MEGQRSTKPNQSAAKKQKLEVTQNQIQHDAKVHAVSHHNSSNLCTNNQMHVAAHSGHVHVVEHIANKGLDIESTTKYGFTPLHVASKNAQLTVVQLLLDNGADIEARTKFGNMPIHVAALYGHKHIVKLFLTKGQNVDVTGGNLCTSLHIAAKRGHLELVKFLVENGANLYAHCLHGKKPMHYAFVSAETCIGEFFLTCGMDVDDNGNDALTSLQFATMSCNLEVVQFLIKKNADVNAQCRDGYTPLHWAVFKTNLNVLECLLAVETINLNAQDQRGKTPLHYACESDDHHLGVMTLIRLLDAGARSDIKDNNGFTAVFAMMQNKFFAQLLDINRWIVHEILEKIHNYINIDDKSKSTAVHIVCKDFSSVDLVKLVLQHQKELNLKDVLGNTPLNYITHNNHPGSSDQRKELIRLFIDNGAYLKPIDCQRIIADPSLKELLADVEFCTKALVNKFNTDLLKIYRLPLATKLPILDRMKVKNSQVKMIELAVDEEIKNNGHCDVSRTVSASLAMLSVDVLTSHYCVV